MDVLADEPLQHLEHVRHGFVQVQDLGGDRLLAGKGQQLTRQVGRAFGGFADFLEVGMERLGRVHLLQGQLGMAEDDAQHVVEVVGHAARQPTDRFHLLGLLELGFQGKSFSDILDHLDCGGDLACRVEEEGEETTR